MSIKPDRLKLRKMLYNKMINFKLLKMYMKAFIARVRYFMFNHYAHREISLKEAVKYIFGNYYKKWNLMDKENNLDMKMKMLKIKQKIKDLELNFKELEGLINMKNIGEINGKEW